MYTNEYPSDSIVIFEMNVVVWKQLVA